MTTPRPPITESPILPQREKMVMDFKPSDFMKMRRPELYSDTESSTEPVISRDVFSYHLETLTNKKQEIEFEHFCRKLLEKEICPNLRPQTGPTGGGDSKVDTETYPVSEEITLSWYAGHQAAQEPWAFAFSAKKVWQPKVKSDVEKIIKTGRGYKLIYFVTNQFAPDKERAKIEDDLTREHGVPIKLLDRSWIIEKIFENKRFEIAIETLHVSFNTTSRQIPGPIDTRRETELRELDAQIDDVARYDGVQYQLAEDALQSAILARGLGRTRNEIEGRFVRAERIAAQVGHSQQRLRIAYTKAWTYYWWFDDVQGLNQHFDEIASLALKSHEASDVEMLVNVWQLLKAHIRHGKINVDNKKWDEQTAQLTSHLDKLACDKERPNNGLFAYSLRLLIDLNNAIESPSEIDEVLKKFKSTLEAGNSLGNYPLESFAEIVMELGEVLPDNKSYDDLFETLIAILEKRRPDK